MLIMCSFLRMKIDDVIKKEEGSNDYEERLLMNLYHINNEQTNISIYSNSSSCLFDCIDESK